MFSARVPLTATFTHRIQIASSTHEDMNFSYIWLLPIPHSVWMELGSAVRLLLDARSVRAWSGPSCR